LKVGKFKNTNRKKQHAQRGYMMITLMLAFALIAIGLLAVLPEIGQQIKRDREEELRHRGTAYMRAIQHFYKKFGRYPTRVEELENTNNVRFLRKRYKDPMSHDPQTGKEQDFKFLHQQDISLNSGIVLPGQMPGQTGMPGQSGLGGMQGQNGMAAMAGMAAQMGGLQQMGGAGGQVSNLNSSNAAEDSDNAGSNGSGQPKSQPSSNGNPGSGSTFGFNGPTFGGGPILGVASTNKEKTIRVFNQKNHYKDWLFVYIPMADRGGLLMGPVQPGMPSGNLNGAATPTTGGLPGQTQGFGQTPGFSPGQGQGFGQNQGLQGGQSQGLSNQPQSQAPQQ
jgi:type II secretory pathway pseudopilin PulG